MPGHLTKGPQPSMSPEPTASFAATRQPSGYSSASFYDYTSLSPSPDPPSSPGFEYNLSLEGTSSSGSETSPRSAHLGSSRSSSSASLEAVRSSSEEKEEAGVEYISSPVELPLSFESGASPDNTTHASLGAPSPPDQGWDTDLDGPSLSMDGDRVERSYSVAPPDSPVVVSRKGRPGLLTSSPASSPRSRPSKHPQRGRKGPGKASGPSTESDSGGEDLPRRLVVFSPKIMLKDLRGECGCWGGKERKGAPKTLKRGIREPLYGKAGPTIHQD